MIENRRPTPVFHSGDAIRKSPAEYVEKHGNDIVTPDLLPDLSSYSLTVGEAVTIMLEQRCKFASSRKVQRLCRDGSIDCYKLSTTRNGQPVTEWLVNNSSLSNRITQLEPKLDDGVATEAPNLSGDAGKSEFPDSSPHSLASPILDGDANFQTKSNDVREIEGDVIETPLEDGDASGETRSLASVLIENARLTATLSGKDELLDEIRTDKEFYKEELREAREGRNDVTSIAERMLETLETIAAGRAPLQANTQPMNDDRNSAPHTSFRSANENQPGGQT